MRTTRAEEANEEDERGERHGGGEGEMTARRATRQGLQHDDEWQFEHDDQQRSADPATRRLETTTAQRRGFQRIPPNVDEFGSTSTCTAQRQGIWPTSTRTAVSHYWVGTLTTTTRMANKRLEAL